ncbi:MAG: nicotinate-nucleotide adenylyltransferase [Acidimicrobiales bacterium]
MPAPVPDTTPAAPPWRRIGVLGGTFDPPHVAHLVAAVNARHALDLDVVLLVVANEPWQKVGSRDVSPVEARLAMTRAACEGVDGVEVSTVEIERGGPSYTVDTLRELRRHHPDAELFLVLGGDAAAGLPSWERAEEVPELCRFVVVDRPGSEFDPTGWPGRWERVEIPRLDIASTDLRARVADGRPLDFLVPPGVLSCIGTFDLYRGRLD